MGWDGSGQGSLGEPEIWGQANESGCSHLCVSIRFIKNQSQSLVGCQKRHLCPGRGAGWRGDAKKEAGKESGWQRGIALTHQGFLS